MEAFRVHTNEINRWMKPCALEESLAFPETFIVVIHADKIECYAKAMKHLWTIDRSIVGFSTFALARGAFRAVGEPVDPLREGDRVKFKRRFYQEGYSDIASGTTGQIISFSEDEELYEVLCAYEIPVWVSESYLTKAPR